MKRVAIAVAAVIGLTAGAAAISTPAEAQFFSFGYSSPGFGVYVGPYPRRYWRPYYARRYYYPRYSRSYFWGPRYRYYYPRAYRYRTLGYPFWWR